MSQNEFNSLVGITQNGAKLFSVCRKARQSDVDAVISVSIRPASPHYNQHIYITSFPTPRDSSAAL